MDIYWIKDKRRCGPSTVPDVISLLQVGELTPDTLGWHAGCSKWLPLRELPALADFLNKKDESAEQNDPTPPTAAEETPAPSQAQAEEGASAPSQEPSEPGSIPQQQSYAPQRVYLPSPLARLLARFVDYGLYTVVFYGILYQRGVPYEPALLLSLNPLLWLPMVAIEAAMLTAWGTTPGKALMGIRLTTFGEVPRLRFLRAFMRSLMVFTLGMGVMMPQILPIMLAFEYWMLRRRGITPWDARCSTLPTQHKPALPSRYVLAIISLYVCAVVTASCMQPWFRGMIADIEKNSPELAQTLREYMPEVTENTPAASEAAAPSPQTPAMPEPASVPELMDTSLPGI